MGKEAVHRYPVYAKEGLLHVVLAYMVLGHFAMYSLALPIQFATDNIDVRRAVPKRFHDWKGIGDDTDLTVLYKPAKVKYRAAAIQEQGIAVPDLSCRPPRNSLFRLHVNCCFVGERVGRRLVGDPEGTAVGPQE